MQYECNTTYPYYTCILLFSLVPDPSLGKREKKRERGKGLGKWPTLPRGEGISFNASARLNCVHT